MAITTTEGNTVRYETPGANTAPTQPVWAPLHIADEVWCVAAGCPSRECIACQQDSGHGPGGVA